MYTYKHTLTHTHTRIFYVVMNRMTDDSNEWQIEEMKLTKSIAMKKTILTMNENLPNECKIHHGYNGHCEQSDCVWFVEKI